MGKIGRERKKQRSAGRQAEELMDTIDGERAEFIQKDFNVEWPDRAIYHSMMNTAIGDEAIAHLVFDLKETYQARATT